jgi:hypothetical protein
MQWCSSVIAAMNFFDQPNSNHFMKKETASWSSVRRFPFAATVNVSNKHQVSQQVNNNFNHDALNVCKQMSSATPKSMSVA